MIELSEKAKSKAQQRFFGMVRAAQKGEMKNPSKEVLDVADDISVKDAKDFAKTKHKGLPNKKEVKEQKSYADQHYDFDAPGTTAVRFQKSFGSGTGGGSQVQATIGGAKVYTRKTTNPTPVKTPASVAVGNAVANANSEVAEGASIDEKFGQWKQSVKDGVIKRGVTTTGNAPKKKKKSKTKKQKWREGGNEKLKNVNKEGEKQSMQGVGGFRGVHGASRKSKAAQGKPAPVVYSYKKKEQVNEGKLDKIMDTVRKYSKKRKAEKKPQKAMDAGARGRRILQRREYADRISGSTENVPDDIRDHYLHI